MTAPCRATTILAVRRGDRVAVGGDGQVTLGEAIIKRDARKIRRLHHDSVIVGFAGAAADAFALMEKFESKLQEFQGNMLRAAYELARDWRTDRVLRRLESHLVAVDRQNMLVVSGSGDVIEVEDGVVGLGSGGQYAVAAARALLAHTRLGSARIVEEALRIAAQICVYTNDRIHIEEL